MYPVVQAEWPRSGVDLLVRIEAAPRNRLVFVEHKRFRTHSHAPGYRNDKNAAWQTDCAVDAATKATATPRWLLGVDLEVDLDFIVLDAHGMEMDQLFPGREQNRRWDVTSYAQLGAALRSRHCEGIRGLVPLLAALYAGHA